MSAPPATKNGFPAACGGLALLVVCGLGAEDLVELNRRVSIDGVKPVIAAADWLRSRGLV